MLFLPLLVQVFQYLLVVLEHGKELRLESIGREYNLFCQITFCNGMFNNLVQFHSLNLQFLHLQVWRDDDLVFIKHLNHAVSNLQQGAE